MKINYTLVVNELTGVVLFSPGLEDLLYNFLCSYASQRLSMDKETLYKATEIKNVEYKTNRNLLHHNIIISFDAYLIPAGDEVIQDSCPLTTEMEIRRRVRIDHPLIIQQLGSVAYITDSKAFKSCASRRIIEYKFDNYRLIIDAHSRCFSIQYKKSISRKLIFQSTTLTLEVLYCSQEGSIVKNPIFVRDPENSERLIGVASFLDGGNEYPSVKSVYIDDNNTVLYYRQEPDNHSTPFHYLLLEHELKEGQDDDDSIYGRVSWQLDASLPPIPSQSVRSDIKPIHVANFVPGENDIAYCFPKIDGYRGTLKILSHHYIITADRLSCTSHPHLLKQNIVHSLRDFVFIVETDLYYDAKYRPSTIVDIETPSSFNAEERMDIIQHLRKRFRLDLAPYHIFFQGELDVTTTIDKHSIDNNFSVKLVDGCIYEVLLDQANPKQIKRICRARPDKHYANPRNVVQEIINSSSDNSIHSICCQ